jgi:hypothetical protein
MLYPIELQLRERGVNKRVQTGDSKKKFLEAGRQVSDAKQPERHLITEPYSPPSF